MTSRPARWWELDNVPEETRNGRVAHQAGRPGVGITCPVCEQAPIVYNGNYFCDNWAFPFSGADGECDWALPHPATRKRDRDICDLIGIDYD